MSDKLQLDINLQGLNRHQKMGQGSLAGHSTVGELPLLQGCGWWLCSTVAQDSVPGKDSGRAGCGHCAVCPCPGTLGTLQGQGAALGFIPTHLFLFLPSFHPSLSTKFLVPVAPWGLQHRHIPLGSRTCLRAAGRGATAAISWQPLPGRPSSPRWAGHLQQPTALRWPQAIFISRLCVPCLVLELPLLELSSSQGGYSKVMV